MFNKRFSNKKSKINNRYFIKWDYFYNYVLIRIKIAMYPLGIKPWLLIE